MKIVYLFAMLLVAAVGAPSVLEEEFRSEFDAHDDDGDGLLNQHQVKLMLAKMFETHDISVDESEVQLSQSYYLQAIGAYISKFDSDRNGISFEEYSRIVRQERVEQQEEKQFAL